MIARLRGEEGQSSLEFAGMIWWLALAVLVVWQLLLVTWTFTQASNAARTASRVQARGGDPYKAARNALTPYLRKGITVKVDHETAVVKVPLPLFIPGLRIHDLPATGRAVLPA
jgi:hypothetical protein